MLYAYVKQIDAKLGYGFKSHLQRILFAIDTMNDDNIKVHVETKSDFKTLNIDILGFQFSFKNIAESKLITKFINDRYLKWDGVNKQICSTTIFAHAKHNNYISNLTLAENCLLDLLTEEEQNYNAGFYSFDKGSLFKIGNHRIVEKDQDKHLKNYLRVNLLQNKNRPIVVTARFARAWPQYFTFTWIRPHVKGVKTITICDHINLMRDTVEKFISIDDLVPHQRYILFVYSYQYPNSDRMGLSLAEDMGGKPIYNISERNNLPKDMLDRCYNFPLEEYLAQRNKKIKL